MSISRSTLGILSLALPLLPAIVHPNLAEGQTGAGHGRSAFIEQVRQASQLIGEFPEARREEQVHFQLAGELLSLSREPEQENLCGLAHRAAAAAAGTAPPLIAGWVHG